MYGGREGKKRGEARKREEERREKKRGEARKREEERREKKMRTGCWILFVVYVGP